MNHALCLRAVLLALCFGGLFLEPLAAKAPARPGVPVEGIEDPAPDASPTPIPREGMLELYRHELGDLYREDDADRLVTTHQLLENYFQADTASGRKEAAKAIAATGEDFAVVGRLTRLRMNWPALAPGVYYVNRKKGPYEMRYYLGVPGGYDRLHAWPLVLKIAPLAPFEVDPPPDASQVSKLYHEWIEEELKLHNDSLVLMPLQDVEEPSATSTTAMNAIMHSLFDSAEHVNIDPSRVYLFGQGTGAKAAWNLALHFPTYFASFASLGGAVTQDWQRLRVPNLRNLPPVVWADIKDMRFKWELSRSLINSMQAQKVEVDYLETHSFGNDPPDSLVRDRYKKMRAHVRSLYPARVTLRSDHGEVKYNRNDWLQIWQFSTPGKETKLVLRGGLSKMILYQNIAKVDARHEGNSFDLTLDNVDSLRLYLNEQMVDLDKPIKITVNKKQTITATPHRTLEGLLNDQQFLGRGWRYYTAVLDIDLGDPSPTTAPATRPTTRPKTGKIIVGPQ